MRLKSASDSCSAGFGSATPALFTSTSTEPKRSCVAAIMRSTSSSRLTSQGTASALPPAAVIDRASSSMRSVRRAASTTLAPAPASASDITTPRPEDAPVMMAVRPSRRNMRVGSSTIDPSPSEDVG